MATRSYRLGRREIQVKENLLDRVAAIVSPSWHNARMVERVRGEAFALAGGYRGGARGRRQTANWRPNAGSANAELLPDLADLRSRSRDMVRNMPMAAGAIGTLVTNVVGTGLMLRPNPTRELLGWDEERTAAWKRTTAAEFRLWAESTNCDASRTLNFYGLQDLAFRSMLENGDVFALPKMLRRPGWLYETAVLLVEADRVSNPHNRVDTERMAGGIETDENGAPLRCHIRTTHPGALNSAAPGEWLPVDFYGARTGRRNVIHLYRKLRIGQNRGAPELAPVVELLKQMSDLSEAELFAAVLNAMVAVVTKTEDRGGLSPLESAVQNKVPESGTSDAKESNWDGSLQAGLAVDLGLNESIETFTGGRPNPDFEPFFHAMVSQMGVALELPFEVLMKKFMASYSAARAALLEAWKTYRRRRVLLAGAFCQPIYEVFLEEAIARDRIDAPGFFDDPLLRAAYCSATWHGDGPGSIDPVKEVTAAKERVAMNLRTLAQEIAEDSGGDVEETLEQRAVEQALVQKHGLQPVAEDAGAEEEGGDKKEDADAGDAEDEAKPKAGPAVVVSPHIEVHPSPVHVQAAAPQRIDNWVFEVDEDGRTHARAVKGDA